MTILYSATSDKKLGRKDAEQLQRIIEKNHNVHGTTDSIRFTPNPLGLANKKEWRMHGSTELPVKLDDAWRDIQINCSVLTLCRRVIPDATWAVDVDGHEIQWDEKENSYDPSV